MSFEVYFQPYQVNWQRYGENSECYQPQARLFAIKPCFIDPHSIAHQRRLLANKFYLSTILKFYMLKWQQHHKAIYWFFLRFSSAITWTSMPPALWTYFFLGMQIYGNCRQFAALYLSQRNLHTKHCWLRRSLDTRNSWRLIRKNRIWKLMAGPQVSTQSLFTSSNSFTRSDWKVMRKYFRVASTIFGENFNYFLSCRFVIFRPRIFHSAASSAVAVEG